MDARVAGVSEDLPAFLGVRPVEPHDDGHADLRLVKSGEDPSRDLVAPGDAAEDVEEDRANLRVRRDHLWDVTRGRISVVYLPPRAVTPEMLVSISDVIGRVVRMGSVVDTILSRHAYPEPVSHALGEALTLTAMLGSALKSNGQPISEQSRQNSVVGEPANSS